jgi:hypothetical protein
LHRAKCNTARSVRHRETGFTFFIGFARFEIGIACWRRLAAVEQWIGASKEQSMGRIIPLFRADWLRPVFIHFRLHARMLQPLIPFELDLWDGDALVSLVAFTQARLRLAGLGRVAEWVNAPLARHEFLNLRTYVRHRGEQGIFFLAEWIPNRLAVLLGPRTYGLPYRLGALDFQFDDPVGCVAGMVKAVDASLAYRGSFRAENLFQPAISGTMAYFLVERYRAFTARGATGRSFRVGHDPWPLADVAIELPDRSLFDSFAPPLRHAELIGAHYSPGVKDVLIGWPRRTGKFKFKISNCAI